MVYILRVSLNVCKVLQAQAIGSRVGDNPQERAPFFVLVFVASREGSREGECLLSSIEGFYSYAAGAVTRMSAYHISEYTCHLSDCFQSRPGRLLTDGVGALSVKPFDNCTHINSLQIKSSIFSPVDNCYQEVTRDASDHTAAS